MGVPGRATWIIRMLALWVVMTLRAEAAEPVAPGVEFRGWTLGGERVTVSVAPFYGWVPGVSGDVRALGAPARIGIGPGDILSNLDGYLDALEGGYIGMGEVRIGRFGILHDVFWADYLSGNTFDGGLFSFDVGVAYEQVMVTMAGSYRLVEDADGHLDALVGARFQSIGLSVGLRLNGEIADHLPDGDRWADPILGVKGRYRPAKRWFVQGWVMVGGFGVSSDILADGMVVAGYEAADWADVWLGYRSAYTDFDNGDFEWNILMHGPIIGFDLRF